MTGKTRRRQYSIIDRSLQYKVLAIIVTYSMVIVLFLAVCLFLPDILAITNESLTLEMRAAAAEKLLTLHSRVWPAIIAMVCVLGIHSVRIFHRLIGPLYRFRWAFDKISEGDLSFRVQIRKSDYLHREEAALNKMIEALAEKCESVQQAGLKTANSLNALEQATAATDGGQDAMKQLLQEHHQNLKDLVDRLEYFRLEAEKEVGQEAE
jgi:methyl-accepting chemotaxis protein